MSTFYDFLIESAPSLAVVLALAGAIGGLLTYVFRRTVREHDAMVTEVRDIKHENIRLAAETARNSDNWELTKRVVVQSLDATDTRVGGVVLRLEVIEGQFADMQQRQDADRRSISVVREQYAGMREDMTQLRSELREIRERMEAIE